MEIKSIKNPYHIDDIVKAADLIDNMTLTDEERKMVESYMTFGDLGDVNTDSK